MIGTVLSRARSNLIWIVGALVISAVVLVAYYSALQIGYWFDDYNLLQIVGRPDWVTFLTSSLDPRAQPLWYRPFQQMQWRVEYVLLGGDALGYHVIQTLFHLANCVLLFGLVGRISQNWRVGVLAALIYASLPIYSVSVFWLSVADPLASLLYLLTIWQWVDFLEGGGWLRFGLTFISFVLALFTKETMLTLPITLLLVDRWLIAKPSRRNEWMLRILPFFLFLGFWILMVRSIIATKLPSESYNAVLSRWLSNLTFSVSASLIFPWNTDMTVRFVAVLVFLLGFGYALVKRKSWLLFLWTVGFISIIPMMNLPFVATRYFYLPSMVAAVGAAAIVEGTLWFIRTRAPGTRMFRLGYGTLAFVVLAVTLLDSAAIGNAAQGFSALARQTRLQFRPIFEKHAAFPSDTLLYFIDPPFSTYNISGLMFLHYGANVTVKGNDYEAFAKLHDYKSAYVFYPDDRGALKEQQGDRTADASVSPSLPVQFGSSISLGGYEIVNAQAKPGEAIVLILYWRALKAIDKDYTVFAHLLNEKDVVVSNHDSQPHHGAWPTTKWESGHLVEDAIILPISSDVPPGQDYRLEIGLYYLPTMQRLPLLDKSGQSLSDKIVIGPFSIVQ